MYRRANYLLCVFIAAGLTAVGMFSSSCTNDLKKIQEISAKQVNSGADTTRGVDAIISDSARVKARMIAPLMLEYEFPDISKSYKLLSKGVKIIMFDKSGLKESGTITADTAYYYANKKMIKLRKNVVATSAKGDIFKSQELNWDQLNHTIVSTKPVDITMANGNIGHGTAMETNEKFSPLTIQNQTGLIYVDSKMGENQ
jgi:LPS export ABC transporter protein LptC